MANSSQPPKNEIPEQVRLRMEYLREQGLDYAFDRPGLHPAPRRAEAGEKASPSTTREASHPPASPSDPGDALGAIRDELGECRRCPLCEKRTQIVFGVGDPRARLLFVGEGPGEEEDRQGIPFVGRAGQLLTDILTKGMGLGRESVYIANVVKCRPPGNRTPLDVEIEKCFPFLRAQILAIRPEVIVTLGASATHTLLGVTTPISRLRGTWENYEGIPLLPTFHPSYLLRNPSAKKFVWEDVQKVLAKLGLPLPVRG